MIVKLRTSKNTQDIFASMKSKENLEPYILSKIAIALSIRKGSLGQAIEKTDNDGLELNRQTIFGEYDTLFKALVVNCEGRPLSEEEYFPNLIKAHLDRGAELLANEKRYTKDFYNYMCRLNEGI
ncbi:MAG: DndE family protein [Clostridia bacterium]